VKFIGSATDEDGNITLYEWDFNGDGLYDWSGSNGETTYSYTKEGRFYAVLRVTDNDGFTATDVREIYVSELGIDPVLLAKDNLLYIAILFALIGGLVYWKNRDYSYPSSSKTKPVTHPSLTRSTPMFSPSSMTDIECPSCGAQMEVPKLGMIQKVTCSECGISGEIEI
jgi:PKD repeat protein